MSALSDGLAGGGTFLLGAGTCCTAIIGWRNGRKIKRASEHAVIAAGKAADAQTDARRAARVGAAVAESVGPANGTSIRDLITKVVEFEQYQHGRNHDLLGQLTLVTSGIPLLIDLQRDTNAALSKIAGKLDVIAEAARTPSNGVDDEPGTVGPDDT